MKTLYSSIRSALFVAMSVFLVMVALVLFSKSPKFGIYFVSASAIGYCINVAYCVFAALLTGETLRGVFKFRKSEAETKVL